MKIKKNRSGIYGIASVLGALQGIQSAAPPCVLGDRCCAAVPASHFAAKNSPPDCFLNAAHPLRVRIP